MLLDDDFTLLRRRILNGFVPIVQNIYGFHSFYVVRTRDAELLLIGIFEAEDGARECDGRVTAFIARDPLGPYLGLPEKLDGKVVATREMVPIGAPWRANADGFD